MNPILEALKLGHNPKKILDFIKKLDPNLAAQVGLALQTGHSIDSVLKYISNFGNKISKALPNAKNEKSSNLYQEAISGVPSTIKNFGTLASSAALGGLGTFALSRALPQAAKALTGLASETPSLATSAIPSAITKETPPPIPPIQAAQSQQQIQQASPALTRNESLFDKFQKGEVKDPNFMDSAFLKVAKSIKKQGGLQTKEEFDAFVKDYEENKGKYDSLPALSRHLLQKFNKGYGPNAKTLDIQPEEKPMTQEIGNLVTLPNNEIGEIEGIKNGIAKVNIDGRITNRKLDDLESLPISKPDLADLYQNLIQAIPEESRSSVINFAGYDADANELIFRPHSGAAYVYKDIPPEFADKLKNSMFKAKTTGDNFYGSWSEGEGSRFAGLHQLIKELQKQYGGKGKEYVRKYETLVDILGEPEKALKQKRKLEIQRRKDEKKRRKK